MTDHACEQLRRDAKDGYERERAAHQGPDVWETWDELPEAVQEQTIAFCAGR